MHSPVDIWILSAYLRAFRRIYFFSSYFVLSLTHTHPGPLSTFSPSVPHTNSRRILKFDRETAVPDWIYCTLHTRPIRLCSDKKTISALDLLAVDSYSSTTAA